MRGSEHVCLWDYVRMDDDSLSVLGQGITPVKLTLQGDCKGQVQRGALAAVSKKRHFLKISVYPYLVFVSDPTCMSSL